MMGYGDECADSEMKAKSSDRWFLTELQEKLWRIEGDHQVRLKKKMEDG